jgi:cyclopropane-fatty-acyl-phospholipid synthase
MIYEFKSRRTGSVVMTQPVAESILQVICKAPGPTGIITVDQMPAAIAALERAVAAARGPAQEDEDGKPVIGLGQRAYPFVDLLKAALAAKVDVTWGV